MEREEAIKRITEEVLARIRGASSGNSLNTSQGSAADQSEKGRSAPYLASGGKSIIMILSGDRTIEDLREDISSICSSQKVEMIVVSDWALRSFNIFKLKGLAPGIKLLQEGDILGSKTISDILSDVDSVYVLDLDIPSASRIADFAPVLPAERVITGAIISGKSVICSHALLSPMAGELTPPCAREAISAVEKKLVAVGVAMLGSGTSFSDNEAVEQALARCPAGEGECIGCGLCVNLNTAGVENIFSAGAQRISTATGLDTPNPDMARMIDHTLLKPAATEDDIRELCDEARRYNFATVCVNPSHVALAARELRGTDVGITTVIGFPLGATTHTAKSIETRDAIANGANEIDMVVNVGALKAGNDDLVKRDIASVVNAAGNDAIVKVILETSLLNDEEKVRGCLLSKMAGADYVKTSTGFGPGGATVEDIRLMRQTVGPDMGVKASGGIRNTDDANAMLEAGASRIGASASVAIVKGA